MTEQTTTGRTTHIITWAFVELSIATDDEQPGEPADRLWDYEFRFVESTFAQGQVRAADITAAGRAAAHAAVDSAPGVGARRFLAQLDTGSVEITIGGTS